MNIQKAILNKTMAVFLIGLLLFPLTVQFAHIFEGHDHKPCGDITTHLHEKKVNCTLFKFHFSNFNYSLVSYPELYVSDVPFKYETRFFSVEITSNTTTYFLRGPPSIS